MKTPLMIRTVTLAEKLTPRFILTSKEHSAMVRMGAPVDHLFNEERFKLLGEMQNYELAFHISIVNNEPQQ